MNPTSTSAAVGPGAKGISQTTPLPREAREGLMRAWLSILATRHPEVMWLPVSTSTTTGSDNVRLVSDGSGLSESLERL